MRRPPRRHGQVRRRSGQPTVEACERRILLSSGLPKAPFTPRLTAAAGPVSSTHVPTAASVTTSIYPFLSSLAQVEQTDEFRRGLQSFLSLSPAAQHAFDHPLYATNGLLPETPIFNFLHWKRQLNPARFDYYHPLLGMLLAADLSTTPTARPPAVAITSPAQGALTNTAVTVTGHVTAGTAPVASLTATVDGGAGIPLVFNTTTGAYSFPTGLKLDGSNDGPHTVRVIARDRTGLTSAVATDSFTLDTRPPVFTFQSPAAGTTSTTNLTLHGTVTDTLSGVAGVREWIDGGTPVAVGFDAAGHFTVTTTLPLDGTSDGPHVLHFRAADRAGNISATYDFPFTLSTGSCGLLMGLKGLTVLQDGGTPRGHGTVTAQDCQVTLAEGDSFRVGFETTLTVPSQTSTLSISFAGLTFDTPDPLAIQDAFEVALVDASGRSLVPTVGPGRDAFFNVTNGQSPVLGGGASLRGSTVTVPLAGLAPGSHFTLIVRLVNNDGASAAHVTLTGLNITPGGPTAPPIAAPVVAAAPVAPATDFSSLSDVSAAITPAYGQTTFDEKTQILRTDLALRDMGGYSAGTPLIVEITHLSDPSVIVLGSDGVAPGGVAFDDYSSTVTGAVLFPGGKTGVRTLEFYDPQRVPFTYTLTVLGQLNRPPAFTSTPQTEAIPGLAYTYQATALDPDHDPLTFSVISGPKGLSIDPTTGLVTWSPQASDLGTEAVALRVSDGRGGTAEQDYTITTILAPPNRPPVFVSTPVVDATVAARDTLEETLTVPVDGTTVTSKTVLEKGATYTIVASGTFLIGGPGDGMADAEYADFSNPPSSVVDTLSDGATTTDIGLAINEPNVMAATKTTRWGVFNPTHSYRITFVGQGLPISLNYHDVKPGDNKGSLTVQIVKHETFGFPYSYHAQATDPDGNTLTYSVASGPAGLSIDPTSGLVTWTPLASQLGPNAVTLRASDGHGGVATQTYTIGVQKEAGDNPPTIISTPVTTINSGQTTGIGLPVDLTNWSVLQYHPNRQPNSNWVLDPTHTAVTQTVNGDPSIFLSDFNVTDDQVQGNWQVNPSDGDIDYMGFVFGYQDPQHFYLFDWKAGNNGFPSGGIGAGMTVKVVNAATPASSTSPLDYSDLGPPQGNPGRVTPLYNNSIPWQHGVSYQFTLDFHPGTFTITVKQGSAVLASVTLHDSTYAGGKFGFYNASQGQVEYDSFRKQSLPSLDYNYPVKAIDPDADPLLYSLTTAPPGLAIDPTSGVISGLPLSSGQALRFNGSDNYVSVPDSPTLDPTNLTVSAWVNFDSLDSPGAASPGLQYLLFKKNSRTPAQGNFEGYALSKQRINGLDRLVFTISSAGGTQVNAVGTTVIKPGEYYNVAGTYDGKTLRIYINGELEDSEAATSALDYGNSPLVLGSTGQTYDARLSGILDDVRIYSSALSPTEIGSTFNRAIDPHVANLVAYLTFDEGNGTVAHDQSLNHNDGTLKTTGPATDLPAWVASAAPIVALSSQVTVRVDDGRGGFDTQSFTISGTTQTPATLLGTVYNDLNANGNRDYLPGTGPPPSGSVTLTQISTTFNNPIDLTYYEPDNSIVASVNYGGGQPHNFDEIQPDGTHVQFTSVAGLSDEVYIASARSGNIGGFTPGDIFVGNGTTGEITRITDKGSTVINPWVTLPGGTGLLRGGLTFDNTGVYAGDLIVTTNTGQVWRVKADGTPTLIADVKDFLEGVTVVPNDPARYGPLAGQILAPNESRTGFWAIDVSGTFKFYDIGISSIENIHIIPANENFFGVDYGSGKILGAPASEFSGMVGDILLDQEYGAGLYTLTWDGAKLQTQKLDLSKNSVTPVLWEGSTFAPAGIGEVPAVSQEPGLANWTVFIDQNHNGQLDPGEPSTVTDKFGNYEFDNITPGTYDVSVVGQPGWTQTQPAAGPASVNLEPGQVVSGIQFGETQSKTASRQPAIVSTPPSVAAVGTLFRYNAVVRNPDGTALTFDLPAHPDGMTVDPSTGVVVWNPTATEIGSQTIVLRVQDGQGRYALQPFQVNVTAANHAPVIVSTPPSQAVVNIAWQYLARAQDAENAPITFGLLSGPMGMVVNPSTGVVSWTPGAADLGPQSVTLTASDPAGSESLQTFTVNVVASAPEVPPSISSTPRTTTRLGRSYVYSIQVSNPGGQPLTYHLDSGPAGMAIDGSGLLTWIPTPDEFGANSVRLHVTDARGGSSPVQAFSVQVVAQDVNHPPVITSTAPGTATVGHTYQYNLVATDADGDPFVFDVVSAPSGVSVDPQLGTLRWSATADQIGSQTIVVRVTDSLSASSTQQCTVDVHSVDIPPLITSNPITTASSGVQYSYALVATTSEGVPLHYSLTTAPGGMAIDPASGVITWTPDVTQVGPQTVGVLVDDGQGGQARQNYSIVVTAIAPNSPPLITSTPALGAAIGRNYTYVVTVTVPDGGPATFQLLEKPAGMTIDPATGHLSWTPTASEAGQNFVTIAATDGKGLGGTQRFAIAVRPLATPTFASSPITTATAGTSYLYDIVAGDSNHAPLTYVLTAGPAGMAVDGSGRVTWSTTTADIGSHHVVLTVTNDQGLSASQTYDLLVGADTTAPLVSVVASEPKVNLGSDVTYTVTATDNVSVASLTLTVGGVAVPLDSHGRATVTMPKAGIQSIIATATDPAGNIGKASITVRVVDPSQTTGPKIILTAPADGTTITSPTAIVGSITSTALESYTVSYAPASQVDLNDLIDSTAPFVTIASGTSPVSNATLATFDPTMLMNDRYVVRVLAQDTSGNVTAQALSVDVTGELKLGDFTRTYTDLTIPLAGIPITITRTYNTLNASTSGDFGYGWTLSTSDAQIHKTVPPNLTGTPFSNSTFKDGTRVYITNPDGKREGFTFTPYFQGFLFLSGYHPAFTPDPGVTDKLSVDDTLLEKTSDGYRAYLIPFDYNPDEFTLTTKDGTAYRYSDVTGLEKVTDPNGNTLTFSAAGITSSQGPAIKYLRDAQGRIGQIIDPAGNSITYKYDARGDLVTVTGQTGLTSGYAYSTTPAHYLKTAYDSLGRVVFTARFDSAGRLLGTTDAIGEETTKSFDTKNFIETTADPAGNVTTLTYDIQGNVISEKNPAGMTTVFSYDANNHVSSTTNARGFTTTRLSDVNDNPTSVTDPLGNRYQATYNRFNKIATATDPSGNLTIYLYDSQGDLVQIVNSVGLSSFIGRDSRGRPTSTTDTLGNVTTYVYGGGASPTGQVNADGTTRHWDYNIFGEITAETDENGNRSELTYDATGNLISQTDAMGNVETYTYNGSDIASTTDRLGRTYQYQYDGAGRRVAQIDPLGGVTHYVYNSDDLLIKQIDPLGNSTTNAWNPDGTMASTTDAMGNTTSFEYDAAGNRTVTTAPLGHKSTLRYDADNRVVAYTDALGHTQTYTYDAGGDISDTTDENGNVSHFTYDAFGSLTSETNALGATRSYAYDSEGHLVSAIDPNGHATTFTLDSMGNIVSSTDPLGGVTLYTYDHNGDRLSVTGPTGSRRQFEYDANGDQVATIDPMGAITHKTYDAVGNLTSVTDPLGHKSTYSYDSLDRLVTSTDPLGQKTTYGYDAAGNQTSITDPLGQRTSFAYDAVGNMVADTNSLGASRTFKYDPGGNLISETDRDGRVRTFTHDAIGHVTQEDWLNGTSVLKTLSYSYDPTGSLLSASDAGSSLAFSYDKVGNVSAADNVNTAGAPHVVLNYRYDAAGNRLSTSDDSGVQVQASYDSRDQLTGLDWQGGGVSGAGAALSYDAAGDLSKVTRFSDPARTASVGTSTFNYDLAGKAVSIQHLNASGVVLASYAYSYNSSGLLTHETINETTHDYVYDANGQLTAVAPSAGVPSSYKYDANGNRTGPPYVAGKDNRLASDGVFNFTYDGEGNLSRKVEISTGVTTDFSYDYRNRLTDVLEHDVAGHTLHFSHYTYDALDHRIATQVDGKITYTVYDGDSPWADYTASDSVSARYLNGPAVDQILARWTPTGGTAWYLADRLGSVRDVTDAGGSVVDHVDYGNFGEILSESNPAFGDRFKFTGQQFDSTTGIYYYQARYYDPSLGQFISEDPLGFAGGDVNLGRYVNNSPVNATDPSGEASAEYTGVITALTTEEAQLNQPGTASKRISLKVPCLTFDARVRVNTTAGGNLAAQDRANFAIAELVEELITKFVASNFRNRSTLKPVKIDDVIPLPGVTVFRHGLIEVSCDLGWGLGDSGKLRNNMKGAKGLSKLCNGDCDAPNAQAHHVVPHNDPRSFPARTVLCKAGIEADDPDNGVCLPRSEKYTNDSGSTPHNHTFRHSYFLDVNLLLLAAAPGGKPAVLAALLILKCELALGLVDYPANAD